MKHPAKIDIAVLLLFFNRPESFGQVFAEVRKARPSKLFLYQDGPRGERDIAGIEACRQVVADKNIDWECDVHRNYLSQNQGCDPSGFRSHKWAFSLADKVIVLEDDVVPSQSFFPFCKEMLDRYEHDERITMIAGFNVDEITRDCPYDYFFTSAFSIWGWASWRRVAEQWDESYSFMADDFNMHQMEAVARQRGYRNSMLPMFRDHSRSGKEYFETIDWANMILNSGLAVMPAKNQINNIGLLPDSTHFNSEINTIPCRLRRIYTMQRHELLFPLKHPKYVIENVDYQTRLYKINAWNHPWIKIQYSLEELCNNLRYGNFRFIWQSMKNRVAKLLGLKHYK